MIKVGQFRIAVACFRERKTTTFRPLELDPQVCLFAGFLTPFILSF